MAFEDEEFGKKVLKLKEKLIEKKNFQRKKGNLIFGQKISFQSSRERREFMSGKTERIMGKMNQQEMLLSEVTQSSGKLIAIRHSENKFD